MPGVHVVTDSACDLTTELAEDRGIKVVPLSIRFGAEEFRDREELSTKEFWDRVIAGPDVPKTAAPSPGAFQQAFEEAADAGSAGVVCVNLSSKVSATYQAACTAAEAVADRFPVRVVDSLMLTMGLGLIVQGAADAADAGRSLDEVVETVEGMKRRAHVYGVVNSLDYLKKGGRIGGAQHLVGSLLSIKPVLEVHDGAVEVESKQRTRSRSLQYLADKALRAGGLERLALTDGAADDIGEVLHMIEGARSEHPLERVGLGPVVGSHAGPGSIGICFVTAG